MIAYYLSHLQMHMEALGGHLIHFAHKDLEIRSKRSLEDHSSISELASHPNVRILTKYIEVLI